MLRKGKKRKGNKNKNTKTEEKKEEEREYIFQESREGRRIEAEQV